MGAFALVRQDRASRGTVCERLEASLREQGFGTPHVVDDEFYRLYLLDKQVAGGSTLVAFPDGDFCAASGTLLFDGLAGSEALRRLYERFVPGVETADAYGSFCVILRKAGRTFIWLDALGIYKVFRRTDGRVWASSFLAVAATLPRVVCAAQEIYEFVFQGATYGNRTIARDIELLDSDSVFEIGSGVRCHDRGNRLNTEPGREDFETQVERNLGNLRRYFDVITANFGSRIDTALSGGYDSRLALGLLLERGVRPRVHVYGRGSDADVRIARAIDAAEHLGLEHIDKSAHAPPAPEDLERIVRANMLAFDGYPTDGLFNNGADLASRRQRCAGGELMLNGGGGEVFRNFFYLPDRSFSVRALLWTFYSAFDPRCATSRFDESAYHDRLAQKLRATLGVDGDILTRPQIELAYPLFRCRFWMGRNNAVNNRLGYSLTPFIDQRIVRDAVTIPLKWKNFGRFEAELVRRVSPRLAAYPSVYGHSFTEPPSLGHRLGELATRWRPVGLRRRSFRMRMRLRPPPRPALLDDPYRRAVLGERLDVLDALFRVQWLRDAGQLNRLLSLEYLLRRCSAELAPD